VLLVLLKTKPENYPHYTEEGETIQLLKEKDKKTNNDLQNTTQNTKD
jgi:hypothetical protein